MIQDAILIQTTSEAQYITIREKSGNILNSTTCNFCKRHPVKKGLLSSKRRKISAMLDYSSKLQQLYTPQSKNESCVYTHRVDRNKNLNTAYTKLKPLDLIPLKLQSIFENKETTLKGTPWKRPTKSRTRRLFSQSNTTSETKKRMNTVYRLNSPKSAKFSRNQ